MSHYIGLSDQGYNRIYITIITTKDTNPIASSYVLFALNTLPQLNRMLPHDHIVLLTVTRHLLFVEQNNQWAHFTRVWPTRNAPKHCSTLLCVGRWVMKALDNGHRNHVTLATFSLDRAKSNWDLSASVLEFLWHLNAKGEIIVLNDDPIKQNKEREKRTWITKKPPF